MVTVVEELRSMLQQTLINCLAQEYPRDRFTVYVMDDGHRVETRQLADSLGCHYIERPDSPRHTKAGNLKYALHLNEGELVAIVQTPHHFYNPDIFQRNLRAGGK